MGENKITAVSTSSGAYNLLSGYTQYDAVLTDLFLPVGSFQGAIISSTPAPVSELSAGLVFAIKAANKGIRSVICTDSDHHRDWVCACLTWSRMAVSGTGVVLGRRLPMSKLDLPL